ncbi:MAG TPA: radical SAM protein [Longimicrobium sp.]|nr:radical SAM protein [Longimicrobium sp.]
MTAPTGGRRILQVHPSLRCNLRCLHCYSNSAPEAGAGMELSTLLSAAADAAAEGYDVLSVSGGEPLLYPRLGELLDGAHGLGMRTTVVSNGMLLDERRLQVLAGRADVLAISLDGVPASHDRMRGSPRAFERMAARLDGVRASGIPFGFIFTLTFSNAHELEWAAAFAVEQGAALLQVHPLEEFGRAERMLAGMEPDDVEVAVGWLEVLRLRAMYPGLHIHADLVDFEEARGNPALLLADGPREGWCDAPLSSLVSPLVVEADGAVVPLQYGIHRRYALGSLADAPLRELARAWKRGRYPAFAELCARTFREMEGAAIPLANWYALVTRMAADGAMATAAAA